MGEGSISTTNATCDGGLLAARPGFHRNGNVPQRDDMRPWTVLVPDRLSPPAEFEQEELGPDTRVILGQTAHAADISDATWSSADAVIAWHEIGLDAGVIAKLERCRIIVRCGVGFDNVDLVAAGARGIPVCNVPDYGTCDVADHAMALLLALMRGLPAYDEAARHRHTWMWTSAGPLRRLAGATLGLVGLGRIGTAVALRARAFGLHVIFHDPYLPDGYDKVLGIERAASLEAMLPRLDAVSFHVPLTLETRGMAGPAFFEALRPGAVVINTARGGILNLRALEASLRSGKVRSAGLDVLDREPADPEDSLIVAWRAEEPWLRHRLLITPHAAFFCREAYEEMRRKAARAVRDVLVGGLARNVVNREWLR